MIGNLITTPLLKVQDDLTGTTVLCQVKDNGDIVLIRPSQGFSELQKEMLVKMADGKYGKMVGLTIEQVNGRIETN